MSRTGISLPGDAFGALAATLVALPSAIAFGLASFAALGPSFAAQAVLAGMVGTVLIALAAGTDYLQGFHYGRPAHELPTRRLPADAAFLAGVPAAPVAARIRLWVDRSFSLTGAGTVFVAIVLLPDASRGKTTEWCGRLPYVGPMLKRLYKLDAAA